MQLARHPQAFAVARGIGEQGAALLFELRQPTLDQRLDRGGNGGPAQLGQGPRAVDQLQGVCLPIGPGQLLDEEGDSLGTGVHALQRGVGHRGSEEVVEQLAGLLTAQSLQTKHLGDPHPVQVGDQLPGAARRGVGVGAEGDQQEDGPGGQGAHQVADQLQTVVVRPLHVVEEQGQGTLAGQGDEGGADLVEGPHHLLLEGETLGALGAPGDRLPGPVQLLQGHCLLGDRCHARGAEQRPEQEERPPQLLVGAHIEHPERVLAVGGHLGGGLQQPGLPDAGLTLHDHGAQTRYRRLGELVLDQAQLPCPPHHRAGGTGRRVVERRGRLRPNLAAGPLTVGFPVSPQHLEQPPPVREALEPEHPAVGEPGVAQRAGQVVDQLRYEDLAALGLVRDPGGGVDRHSLGVPGGLHHVAAVQPDPDRDPLVRVRLVVLLDRPLDGNRGLDGLIGRGEEAHEPVTERLGFDRPGDAETGADALVMHPDHLVGGAVTEPDSEIGGAFEVGEEDGQGPLGDRCRGGFGSSFHARRER